MELNSICGQAARTAFALAVALSAVAAPGLAAEPKISAGYQHNMALAADGTVYTWGDNSRGQLGDGSSLSSTHPIRVPGMDGSTDIAAGGFHSVAKRYDRIWTWGYNAVGQLGDGTFTDRPLPVQVDPLTFTSHVIGAGDYNTFIEQRTFASGKGYFVSTGQNTYGERGDSDSQNSGSFRSFGRLIVSPLKIEGGANLSAVLTDTNEVWTWGINYDGSLGMDSPSTHYRYTPLKIPLVDIVDIAVGTWYMLAAREDGRVWSWGNNRNYYFLGRNDMTRTPGLIPGLDNVRQVATGGSCSAALKNDGTVWMWGSPYSFVEGVQTRLPISNVASLSGKGGFLAMKTDGTVWQWACGASPQQVRGENGVGVLRLIDEADLSVTLTDDRDPVVPGEAVTLQALVRNDGPDTASSLVATFTLPDDVVHISTDAPDWACDLVTRTLTCRRSTLDAFDSDVIDVVYRTPTGSAERVSVIAIAADSFDPVLGNDVNQEFTVADRMPLIGGTPEGTVLEDIPYMFVPTVDGLDANETLTFQIESRPLWASFDSATGTLGGTPGNDDIGVFEDIVISVTDGRSESMLPPFDLTVVNVNDAPTISGVPPASAIEDTSFAFTPSAADIDVGDTLTFAVSGAPTWLVLDPATGTLSGTPSNADVGTRTTITLSVSDGSASAALAPFDLTVVNVNDAPTISGVPPASAIEDTPFAFTPSAADIDVGDTLTFAVSGAPTWLVLDPATGTLSGTPSNADVGTRTTITLSVSDGSASAALAPFDLTVVNVNDAPTISGVPPASAIEDTPFAFTPSAADIDVGDTLTFAVSGAPTWLVLDPATGTLSGTPSNADVGTRTAITLSVSDGSASAALAPFDLTVVNVNDAPTISGVPPASAIEDTPFVFTPSAADIDVGDTLTFAVSGAPTWLVLDPATGEIGGVPGDDAVGLVYTVTLSVSDGSTTTSLPPFDLRVMGVNDAPTGNLSVDGIAEERQTLSVVNTVSDADGIGTLSFQWYRDAEAIVGQVSPTYRLEQSDVGRLIHVVASYTDAQGTNESVSSLPVGPVANVNDAPAIGGNPRTSVAEGSEYVFTPTASDADGDRLIFNIDGLPEWATFDEQTGTLAGVPGSDATGSRQRVLISVDDGIASAYLAPFELSVTNVNDIPTGDVLIRGIAREDEVLTVSQTISDADGVGTIAYQWLRAGAPIEGANDDHYSTVDLDVGQRLSVLALYTDGHDNDERVVSATTQPIENVNDAPRGSVNIIGNAHERETLSVDPTFTDNDGVGPSSVQWFRNGDPVVGAVDDHYTLTNADVGSVIAVSVSYVDGHGQVEEVRSEPTGTVGNIDDAPEGHIQIVGLYRQNETLQIVSSLYDPDGMQGLVWQWLRDGEEIDGANEERYSLTQQDVGTVVGVRAIYTDAYGNVERVDNVSDNSLMTLVANVNDTPIIGGVPDTHIEPGESYIFTPTASDADGDVLTFFASGLPAWASLDASSGRVSGSPKEEDAESASRIAISVSDGLSSTELPVFVLSVGSPVQPEEPSEPSPAQPEEPSEPSPAQPEEPSEPSPAQPEEPSEPSPAQPEEPSEPSPAQPEEPSEPSPAQPEEPSEPSPAQPEEPSESDESVAQPSSGGSSGGGAFSASLLALLAALLARKLLAGTRRIGRRI